MTTSVEAPVVEWAGCYEGGWKGLIHPDAFAHPAKMSRALLERIFDHLFAIGALKPGDTVIDPFGGIGSTGLIGASRGVQVISCELEPKFYELAQRTYAGHQTTWEAFGYPPPVIVQGDSRKLRAVLGEAPEVAAILSSPPYTSNGLGHGGGSVYAEHDTRGTAQAMVDGYGDTPGNLGEMPDGMMVDAVLSSPPYEDSVNASQHGIDWSKCDPESTGGRRRGDDCQHGKTLTNQLKYGDTEGQLGAMRGVGGVDAVIASPPYAEIAAGSGGLNTTPAKDGQQGGRSAGSPSQQADQRYGESAGQMARMAAGDVDAIVSSPPFTQGYAGGGGINREGYRKDGVVDDKVGERTYQGTAADRSPGNVESLPLGALDVAIASPPYENTQRHREDGIDWEQAKRLDEGGGEHQARGASAGAAMSPNPENISNRSGETFWSAALQIVQETYAVLKPGGRAVWIVKAFVRDKKVVDFPADWRTLCEHVGFVTELEARAMLVKEERRSDLFDGEVIKKRERKSFFRRLAEKKGSPRIDWETVYVMVKR